MTSEHTPEPWHTTQNAVRPSLDWVLRPGIGGVVTEADARRIVAAINACEGIPIEVLEAYKDGGLWKHLMNCPAVTQW